ncbi:thrombospondin-1-like [Saccostrea echinata]|uniref:thrombospondin-1-like n=1 Tax=Saccostrea echinata TaxID=191078 RepID=UPI002A80A943|nr:thrombospondin-1-like [Saccostrea echinata]
MKNVKVCLFTAYVFVLMISEIYTKEGGEKNSMAGKNKQYFSNTTKKDVLVNTFYRQKRDSIVFEEDDFDPNGGYGPWSIWSLCSKSCGTGQRTRRRTCHDVTRCHAGNVELQNCFLRKCRS